MAIFSSTSLAKRSDVEVELITIGPGQNYWEAFGHTALRVRSTNTDYLYGFGYFNFEDEDFFINFAKGEMQYFMGIQETAGELADYQDQGREIWSQKLLLSSIQISKLLQILNFLAQPENRYYHYDYFLNNCTTRIRDILDKVTHQDLSHVLKETATEHSWNDLTFPVINQAWMNLGIAMAYGLPAYQTRNKWQLSVFPETFAQDLESLKTDSQWNQPMQLIYQPNKVQKKLLQYSFFETHYAMILILSILFLGLLWSRSTFLTINMWLLTQSLLGIGLLLLWSFTKHTVAAQNINVLLFFPIGFILMLKKFRNKHVLSLFLGINIMWFVAALFFTNLYLFGFWVINLIIWNKFRKEQ